jgi:hypothetical protein
MHNTCRSLVRPQSHGRSRRSIQYLLALFFAFSKRSKSCKEVDSDVNYLHERTRRRDHYCISTTKRDVCQVIKQKRIGREFKMTTKLGGYDTDGVMLDLGSNVNILPKKS